MLDLKDLEIFKFHVIVNKWGIISGDKKIKRVAL